MRLATGLCHVHHETAWAEGGATNLDDRRLLCPHHHARTHDPAYDHEITPDHQIRYHHRT